jgi:hypothetical protein
MEITKVIVVNPNSLGFEVGDDPVWRGEFTLEQVAEFNIKAGMNLTVHLLEMEDTFATVEFGEGRKTSVPIIKVPHDSAFFPDEPPPETDTPEFNETLRGEP